MSVVNHVVQIVVVHCSILLHILCDRPFYSKLLLLISHSGGRTGPCNFSIITFNFSQLTFFTPLGLSFEMVIRSSANDPRLLVLNRIIIFSFSSRLVTVPFSALYSCCYRLLSNRFILCYSNWNNFQRNLASYYSPFNSPHPLRLSSPPPPSLAGKGGIVFACQLLFFGFLLISCSFVCGVELFGLVLS